MRCARRRSRAAASAQVGGKAAGKLTGFALRTAAKVATLGHMGKKKDGEGAGQTKAEKRQRAVRPRACWRVRGGCAVL